MLRDSGMIGWPPTLSRAGLLPDQDRRDESGEEGVALSWSALVGCVRSASQPMGWRAPPWATRSSVPKTQPPRIRASEIGGREKPSKRLRGAPRGARYSGLSHSSHCDIEGLRLTLVFPALPYPFIRPCPFQLCISTKNTLFPSFPRLPFVALACACAGSQPFEGSQRLAPPDPLHESTSLATQLAWVEYLNNPTVSQRLPYTSCLARWSNSLFGADARIQSPFALLPVPAQLLSFQRL
jgi:hypothetical protein